MDGTQYASSSASLFVGAARKPQMAYAIRPMTREVVIVKFGEEGFYQTDYGVQSREWVEDQNAKLGVDAPTASAMAVCSVFGDWTKFETIRDDMLSVSKRKEVENAG